MNKLILNLNSSEPENYIERKTVKGLILNVEGNILMLRSTLIGGGLEKDESFEEALKREAIEEVGAVIEIKNLIGEVIQYRDFLKMKYVVRGYICEFLRTTESEENREFFWRSPIEALEILEKEIKDLIDEKQELLDDDKYQSKLFNRQTALFFIKRSLLLNEN